MPSKGMKKEMGDRHEQHLIDVLGGKQSKGSGNQWHSPMDGRQDRREQEFAFAWDGKSTTTGTISVTIPMWEKAVEQANGERPMLAFRWYMTERPQVQNRDGLDLACVSLLDLSELLDAARSRGDLLAALADLLDQGADPEWDAQVHLADIKRLIEEHS